MTSTVLRFVSVRVGGVAAAQSSGTVDLSELDGFW